MTTKKTAASYSPEVWERAVRLVLEGGGDQPLFTIPLSQLSTAGLPPRDTADASALSMMMRNLDLGRVAGVAAGQRDLFGPGES